MRVRRCVGKGCERMRVRVRVRELCDYLRMN